MSKNSEEFAKGEGYGAMCPACGGMYHETTEFYMGDRATTGKMLRLRPQWGADGENWLSFPGDDAIRDADLECPGCGNPYTQGTRVSVIPLDSMSVFEAQEDAEIESLEALDKVSDAVDKITAPGSKPQAVEPQGARQEIKAFKARRL